MGGKLGRSEDVVRQALRKLGLDGDITVLDKSARTAQLAANALGCSVDQIVKSLVFQGSQSGDCVLALVSGSKRVREAKLQELVGEPVSMARADTVRTVTGFAIGGVPPLGHARAMPTYIDEELLGYQCLWAAAGSPRAVFSLSPEELARISDGRVVDLG